MIPPSPVHACIHTLTHSTPWHAFTTSSFIHYWGEAEFCYSVHSHYSVFQPEVGITTPVSLQQGTFASIMLSALVFYQFTWTVLRETLDVTQGLLALTGVTTWLIAVLPLCVCVSVCMCTHFPVFGGTIWVLHIQREDILLLWNFPTSS